MKNKSVYNPKKELTDEEISKLSDTELFEYLDAKEKYLKQFSAPLDSFHSKRYAAMSKGDVLTTEELRRAKELGKRGDDYQSEWMVRALEKKKNGKNKRNSN
jgi:hypothetical protein